MSEKNIYETIAKRCAGDIYIGVVGPVRSGKSTFIQKFLDAVVLPNIENEYDRERTLCEMPQSATGRTIMTTEPKFVPDEAVRINVGGASVNVKLIDCVGYVVDGALGVVENGEPRLIKTPWSDTEMPLEEAAELGTSKVISEHSTIGVLVSCDGTIGEIPRDAYIAAEERAARELTELGKPYAIVLNSATPEAESSKSLAISLEEKYGVPVALVNCMQLGAEDCREIIALILSQFPVRTLTFSLPAWCEVIPPEHEIHASLVDRIRNFCEGITRVGDIDRAIADNEGIEKVSLDLGCGVGEFAILLGADGYFKAVRELSGMDIENERDMLSVICELAVVRQQYDRIKGALGDVYESGYGIVMPSEEEIRFDEPRVAREGTGYGVRVSAYADCIHMIKTELRADVCPVIGTQEQTESVLKYLSDEVSERGEALRSSGMFGKSIYDLVGDDMRQRLSNIPTESRAKLGATLERVVNEGANGLICILL